MAQSYTISRDYPFPANLVWTDVVSFDALADSMAGSITYEGLPSGEASAGQVVTVQLKRWGWFPMGRWTMHVVERDDQNFVLRSEEYGGPVRRYEHRLKIEAKREDSCRYTDQCDVDAGWLTPIIAPQFKAMYERRHDQRLLRLKDKYL